MKLIKIDQEAFCYEKKSVLSLLLAAALALSLAGCAGQGRRRKGACRQQRRDHHERRKRRKITETAARSIETELYETADFSLQIPKGWTVTSGGTAMYHSIRVQDPSQPLNQMFVLLKAEGCCTARRERTPMRITSPWGTHGRRCFPRLRC